MTASGIEQVIARRDASAALRRSPPVPASLQPYLARPGRCRGRPDWSLSGWTSPQMLRRYGASARSARAHRSYDRIIEDTPYSGMTIFV